MRGVGGFHAVHVNDVNLISINDKFVARYALDRGMTLITNNMGDFKKLYSRRKYHPGLIFMKCVVEEIFTPENQVTLLDIVLDDMLEKDLIQESLQIELKADLGDDIEWEIDRHPHPRDR
jgi:predicted nuclease of predicted toxin-antitoxin system